MKRMWLCLLLLCASRPAFAQQDPKAEQARQHYEDGKKYYRLGDIDKAIEEWKAGYLVKDDPGFLFNIAQAYREMATGGEAADKAKSDAQQGIKFYENYLKEAPNASNRDVAEKHIDELKAIAIGTAPVKPPESQPVNPIKPPDTTPPPPNPIKPPPPVTTHEPSPGNGLRLAGIVTGSAGVVFLAGGAIFGAMAHSAQAEVNDAAASGKTWDSSLASKDSSGRTDSAIAVAGFVVGGVAIAGGVVLYVLGHQHKAEQPVAIIPAVAPGAASLSALVRF